MPNYFLKNLERLKARTLVKSIRNDKREINIKLIGKINVKLTTLVQKVSKALDRHIGDGK